MNNDNNNIIITTIKGDWPFKRTALLLNTSWWLAANQSAGLFWSRLLLRVSWHVEGKKRKKKTANRNPTCDCFQRSAQLIGSCCYRVDVPTQLLGSIWRWAVYCQGNKQTRRWHVWKYICEIQKYSSIKCMSASYDLAHWSSFVLKCVIFKETQVSALYLLHIS